MTDKSTSRLAPGAKVLAVALAGCGVLATCDVASADYLYPSEPTIVRVDGQGAVEERDGLEVFQAGELTVPVSVASSKGSLVLRDQETGEVVCEDHQHDYATSAPCPAFITPGDHRIVAEVTDDRGLHVSEPVIIEQYASAPSDDGQAPGAVTVESTAPGERDDWTAVTLRGTPGDRLVVRDEHLYDIADEVIGASGLVTVQVPTAGGTVHLQAETQRSGQHQVTHLDVQGVPAVEAGEAPGDVDPGFTLPVIADDAPADVDPGFTLPVVADDAPADVDPGFSIGDALQPVDPIVAFPAPGAVDPGFTAPVVADDAPGDVDPGFTAPVVADDAPSDVDPGFTAGDEEQVAPAPGEIVVVGTAASDVWASTDVTLAAAAGQMLYVTEEGERTPAFTGYVPADGRVTFPVHIPAGESATFRVEIIHDFSSKYRTITVDSALGVEPVVAVEAPADVDPGFTAGDAEQPAEPVAAVEAPADVDPGFTAGDAEQPVRSVEATVGLTGPSNGGTAFVKVVDHGAQAGPYQAQVLVDGQLKGNVTVSTNPMSQPIKGIGTGQHTLEFVVDGTVVGSVTVTL